MVMFDKISGVLEKTSGEGTHFLVPWLQSPNVMDIRTRPRSISSVTGTKGALANDRTDACDGRAEIGADILTPEPKQTCKWST